MKKTFASTALAALFAAGVWSGINAPAYSGGETRTLSLYHVHTGESLTITYKSNGKYVPSALKKINYLMRDWRRKETIAIDPKMIDLMWELHADLGSRRPIHIICGYRSPKTNAFLKRVGRNVARKSQHMVGKAIDLYFPDVPSEKIRNSALVRQVGGVGYYRSSGGPTGFVHIDSSRVRYWGPKISPSQMAQINRDYRKTVGARLNKADSIAVADSNSPSQQDASSAAVAGGKKKNSLNEAFAAYDEGSEEMAELAADAAAGGAKPKSSGDTADSEGIVKSYPVPKPRPKPIEVLMMAAMNIDVQIEPASAPPDQQGWNVKTAPSPVQDSIGMVEAAGTLAEESAANQEGKGSLLSALTDADGEGADVPVIRPLAASSGSSDLFWWKQMIFASGDKAVRRDGEPQPFAEANLGLLPGINEAQAESLPAVRKLAVSSMSGTAFGKGDMLVVNREGKGNLLANTPATVKKRQKLGQLESD